MGLPSARWQRRGHALFVVLALLANAFASSVPLLHALAHEHAHQHGHAHGYEHAHSDHGRGADHDEIHPGSLHDEYLTVIRAGLDLTAAPVPELHGEPVALTVAVAPFLVVSALHSRAPPRAPSARAPPLV
jgi:hypothetical protein